MKSFAYWNPVRVSAGPDALTALPEACAGKKTLVMYGGGSAKANGSLDAVVSALEGTGAEVVPYGGVRECNMDSIAQATAFVRGEDVQAVVGLGGAAVMDTAKAVAFAAVHEDYERYFLHELEQRNDEKLTLVLVPTYPSTGSEADGVSDIIGFSGGVERVWPDLAVLYPPFTYSLDARATAFSTMVLLSQTGYRYFTDDNPISKGQTVAVLRAVLDAFDTLVEDPENEDARGTMLWASWLQTSGISGVGVSGFWQYSIFSAGKACRLAMGTTYREGLAMILPRWLVWEGRKHPEELASFAVDVFDADPALPIEDRVRVVFDALMDVLRRGGLPTTLDAYGERPSDEAFAQAVAAVSSKEFTPEEYRAILDDCYTEDFPGL